MCRPKAPHFSAWAAPKDSTFSTWTAPKDPPFQKYTLVNSTFPTWAAPKDPPFKNIRFFLILSSETPSIFSEGPLWKPLILKLWAAHIYIYKPPSYMSIARVRQTKVILMIFPSFFFLRLSVCLSNNGHLLSFPSFFFLCLLYFNPRLPYRTLPYPPIHLATIQ